MSAFADVTQCEVETGVGRFCDPKARIHAPAIPRFALTWISGGWRSVW
jgi:hypothetical protein